MVWKKAIAWKVALAMEVAIARKVAIAWKVAVAWKGSVAQVAVAMSQGGTPLRTEWVILFNTDLADSLMIPVIVMGVVGMGVGFLSMV